MEDTALFMYDGTVFGNKESATSKSIYNENETSYSIPTNLYSTSPTFATTNEEEDEETIIICPPNQIVHLIQLFDTGGNGWGSTKLEIVETSSASALHDSEEEDSVIIFVGSLDASNGADTYNNERRRSKYDATISTHSHRTLKRPSNTGCNCTADIGCNWRALPQLPPVLCEARQLAASDSTDD
jgi:hypothetical protein